MRILKIIFLIGLFAISFSSFKSYANDSVASVTVEGIKLLKTESIRMKTEHLSISPYKIRVEYEFYNESAKDITTEVAFPMPDIVGSGYGNISAFNDFSVFVDNHHVPYKRRLDNPKLVKDLKRFGLPLDRFVEAKDVSPENLKELIKLGYYDDVNPEGTTQPNYVLSFTNYWTQTFPAHKTIRVVHEYEPNLGNNSISVITFPEKWKQFVPNMDYSLPSCGSNAPNPQCRDAYNRFTTEHYPAEYVEYVLSTGSNWKNGIENFYLSIDGAAFFLVEMDGKTDVGLGRMDIEKHNFSPKKELLVEFVGKDKNAHVPPPVILNKKVDGPANCRQEPEGKILLAIPDDTEVALKDKENSYYKVVYKDISCWLHEQNLPPRL